MEGRLGAKRGDVGIAVARGLCFSPESTTAAFRLVSGERCNAP